jgi:hypothetical protein
MNSSFLPAPVLGDHRTAALDLVGLGFVAIPPLTAGRRCVGLDEFCQDNLHLSVILACWPNKNKTLFIDKPEKVLNLNIKISKSFYSINYF